MFNDTQIGAQLHCLLLNQSWCRIGLTDTINNANLHFF